MSMMYPNGSPIPGANQFQVGGQPNYAAPLVNFSGAFNQGAQATRPQPQAPQPGATSPPSGPNMGGKAAGQQSGAMNNFAAKLRAFFNPQGGGMGGATPANAGTMAPGVGFGMQPPQQQPMLPSSGAGFNPNGLY